MTFDMGAINHHSSEGAYLRASHNGTLVAISQKNGAIVATMTNPSNR